MIKDILAEMMLWIAVYLIVIKIVMWIFGHGYPNI